MKKSDAVKITRRYIEGQFPKSCPNCKKEYATLYEYLKGTSHQGSPISYDASEGNWKPKTPLGTFSMANCSCGNTLAVDSGRMNLFTMWKLLRWAKKETNKKGISISKLLSDIRDIIDKQVTMENEKEKGSEEK